jgi:hypothetical protein
VRSLVPIPGNPWPHEMVITIEDDSHALIELLWIREAWNLHPAGDDLPPLLSDASVSAQIESGTPAEFAEWQDAWPAQWEACVHHAGMVQDARLFDQLFDTADGSDERARLLSRIAGPNWRDTFGRDALTDGYQAWTLATFEARSGRQMRPYDEQPEWVSLTALTRAWRAGMSKIVVIPCRGTYTRVIGEHSVLMTAETRDDPQRYSEALARFR